MKNKCEICRCLLFEADVWSALPESNQLFPQSFLFLPPPPILSKSLWKHEGLGDCRTIGHCFIFQLPGFKVAQGRFFRLLSSLAKVTADAGRGPIRHNIVWRQNLNATLPVTGEVVASWEGASESWLWSPDGAVWPRPAKTFVLPPWQPHRWGR